MAKKKPHQPYLTASDKSNRKTNSRKLYEQIAGSRSEFAVSIDEAQIAFNPANHQTEIYYGKRGEDAPLECVASDKVQFPQKFMVITGITGRGPLKMFRVPEKTKVNAQLYLEVLTKIIEEELPKIYPGEMDRVFFHHDKASSHTASITTHYLESKSEELGIRFLNKNQIPVKGADISPMDFFGFGFIKNKLKTKKPATLDGCWKLARAIWASLPLDMPSLVMSAWKRRCRIVHQNDGEPIEHLRKIHLKRN